MLHGEYYNRNNKGIMLDDMDTNISFAKHNSISINQ